MASSNGIAFSSDHSAEAPEKEKEGTSISPPKRLKKKGRNLWNGIASKKDHSAEAPQRETKGILERKGR
jgi:hypothetical protein